MAGIKKDVATTLYNRPASFFSPLPSIREDIRQAGHTSDLFPKMVEKKKKARKKENGTADESMVSVFEDVVPGRHNFSRPKLCAF